MTPPTAIPQTKQVDARHSAFNDKLPEWTTVHDAVAGERAMKRKGEVYLPRPNPEDTSAEADKRYDQYKARAVFVNATGRTLEGLVGQVFRKQTAVELTPRLKLIEDNVDGTGQTLEQLAKLTLARVLSYGRCGLLADYPQLPEGAGPATVADLDSGNLRPKVVSYSPFKIVNWRAAEIGARAVLSLVVLEEDYAKEDDGFATTMDVQYRVLRLNVENKAAPFYQVEIWRKATGGKDAWEIVQGYPITPKDSTGKPFKEIPFCFVGWQSNTPAANSVPLFDLASVNVHHYMVSADYYEAVFLCGQPTPVFSGLTKDWVRDVFPSGKILLGTRAGVPLPQGGTAQLLQPAPNTLAKEAMDDLSKQMVALGAQLIEVRDVQRTATEAKTDTSMGVSVLSSSAKNVSEAVTRALQFAGMFIGEVDDSEENEKIYIELNTDFDLSAMTAADRAQLLKEWQSNGITTEEYRYAMNAAGVAFLDFEKYKDGIEADKALFPPPVMVQADPGTSGGGTPPAKGGGTPPAPASRSNPATKSTKQPPVE